MKVSNKTANVKAKKAKRYYAYTYYAYARRLYVNKHTQVKLVPAHMK